MKLLLLLLFPLSAFCQDSLWVKIRSMAYNGTEDTWVRKGTAPDRVFREGLPKDTVYIDSFRSRMYALAAQLERWKKAGKPNPSNHFADSAWIGGVTFVSSGSFAMRRWDARRAKKKRRKPVTSWMRALYGDQQCPLDTIRGILMYNSKIPDQEQGNGKDSGMWVGCNKLTLSMSAEMEFIPAKRFNMWEYMDGRKEFETVNNGVFFDADGDHIGNYRVYGLKYQTNTK